MGLPLYCLLIPCESDSDPLLAQLLFDGLDNTLNTFQILDPERRIFTPTFYFYFSKLVKKEQIKNPLAQLETVSERSTEQVTARCALLAIQLRNIGKKFHPQDAVQVNQFVQYFGAGTPPWIGEKTVNLGLARAVIAQFEGLVQRLESDLTDVKVTQLFAEEVRHSPLARPRPLPYAYRSCRATAHHVRRFALIQSPHSRDRKYSHACDL